MTMADKIKQTVADEFKYRAGHGRTQYSAEEVIYIVNEVIDEVTFEKTGVASPEQMRDFDLRIRIIKGDLLYLAEKVNELSSQLEEKKIKGGTGDTERPQGEWLIVDDTEKFIAKCSVCGRIEDSRKVQEYPFCHCGADMRGNKKETTFADYLKKQLKDPEFRKEWEKLCDEEMRKGGTE